jgi:hypothetical protein
MGQPDCGEFDDLIVARVLDETADWGITVTEADVRASLDRLRNDDARLTPEVARRHVWAIFPEPRQPLVVDLSDRVVDLTERVTVA